MLPLCFLHLVPLTLLAINGGGGVHCMEENRVLSLHDVQRGGRSSSQTCSPQRSRREKGAAILEMKHHSYCSDPITNWEDKLHKILLSDEIRISSVHSRIKNAASGTMQEGPLKAQIPIASGAKLQTLNYIVTVELAGRKSTVIVDTGSDLTWVQCKPCSSCYNQQGPLFDPSTSSSYRPVPCNSPTCDSLVIAGISRTCGSDRPSCNYMLSYGDGSYSRGFLGTERIGLADTVLESFVFGCGRDNRGLFGGTSGLMGLGRSQLSLVSQASPQFGGVFSYCLPTKEYDSSGSLIFGDDPSLYKNTTSFTYTRMISDPQQHSPFYYLNLTGISIGGVDLQASGFSTGRILIDSGTVISRLVPSVYKAVRAEVMKRLSRYPLARGFSILDTCFDLAGYKEVEIPELKLKLEGGVEVEVDVGSVLYFAKEDASQVCLALASLSYEDEVGIIGNYQQKNLRIVYDTVGSRLGFAREACGYGYS